MKKMNICIVAIMLFATLCSCSGEINNKTDSIVTSKELTSTNDTAKTTGGEYSTGNYTSEEQEEKLSFINLDVNTMQSSLKKALDIKDNTKITPIKQYDYYNIHRYTVSTENSEHINLSFTKNWLAVDISNGDVFDKPLASDYSYEKLGTIQDFYNGGLEENPVKVLEPQLKKFFKTENEYEHIDNNGSEKCKCLMESTYEFSVKNDIYVIIYNYSDEKYTGIYLKENDNLKYYKEINA